MSNVSDQAIDFKSANLFVIRVVLQDHDTKAISQAVKAKLQETGSLFENEAVVIDASNVSKAIEWNKLVPLFKESKLPIIGVYAEGKTLEQAQKAGLTFIDISTSPMSSKPSAPAPAEAAPPISEQKPVKTPSTEAQKQESKAQLSSEQVQSIPAVVINRPLRSGQRIYAKGTDLIIMAPVSRGAEVIADGNIHVYGPLRGKAMAGARGNTSAKIFTSELDAELLAIAGYYRVIDKELEANLHKQPAFVELDNESINITPLNNI